MKSKLLTFAREYRNMTQGDLANAVPGLSQSTLSKFEKGLVPLSENIQSKIIEYLKFPSSFFEKNISLTIENANYRKRASLSKSVKKDFEFKFLLTTLLIDELSNTIEWPEFKLQAFNVEEGFPVKNIAKHTRRFFNIPPDQPIIDFITKLEELGILVFEIDAHEKIDGLSTFTELGTPFIVINKNYSNDRKRFTLAHELGHLIMHNGSNFLISEYRDKEFEANEFASEFLMPEEEIRHQLFNLKLSYLSSLKCTWQTSMASIIRRAYDLNCIDEKKKTHFYIEMSRMGYSKNEPVTTYLDSPTYIKKAITLFVDQLGYTYDEIAEYCSIPRDAFDELFMTPKVIKFRRAEEKLSLN